MMTSRTLSPPPAAPTASPAGSVLRSTPFDTIPLRAIALSCPLLFDRRRAGCPHTLPPQNPAVGSAIPRWSARRGVQTRRVAAGRWGGWPPRPLATERSGRAGDGGVAAAPGDQRHVADVVVPR